MLSFGFFGVVGPSSASTTQDCSGPSGWGPAGHELCSFYIGHGTSPTIYMSSSITHISSSMLPHSLSTLYQPRNDNPVDPSHNKLCI